MNEICNSLLNKCFYTYLYSMIYCS